MKAFIISLSQIKSSFDSAQVLFKELKKQNFNVSLFEGTYGNDAEKLFLETNRILDNDFKLSHSWKHTSPGVKGCFYSHYRLWELCYEMNESIAIFEDDVIILKNFIPIDFDDILVLSINYDWNIIRETYKVYLEQDFDINTNVVYRHSCMPGASGYIIKPIAAKKLLEKYKNTYLPADIAINDKICKIKLHPRLMGRSKTMNEKISLTRVKGWI
jgi:glycosyl transferase family 25